MTNEPQNDKNNKESQLSGWNAFDGHTVVLVLFTAMLMTLTLENPASAKSLTNANNNY